MLTNGFPAGVISGIGKGVIGMHLELQRFGTFSEEYAIK